MPYDFDAAVGYTAPNYTTTNSYLDYQINSVTDVQLTNIMSFRKVNVDGPNILGEFLSIYFAIVGLPIINIFLKYKSTTPMPCL